MGNLKFKVNDRVRVKSLEWYNENKNSYHCIKFYPDVWFRVHMSEYCGKIVTISNIYFSNHNITTYNIVEDDGTYIWTDDMFESLVEEKTTQLLINDIIFPNKKYADKVELCLGDDYEIVVEDGKTFVQKKKPKYPMTYEECCGVLGMTFDYPDIRRVSSKEHYLYSSFFELIRCRDAYWKIAGEQMGLGKSWRPDYVSLVNNEYFTIHTFNNEIIKSGTSHRNAILAFPTVEMRDVFFENFKDLIEKM